MCFHVNETDIVLLIVYFLIIIITSKEVYFHFPANFFNKFTNNGNDCRLIKMNVFCSNETDICVIDSIFSGNNQQKV